MTMTVGVGYVEVEGKGELVGRGTERTHFVRLADVVAGGRRTVKRRRQTGSTTSTSATTREVVMIQRRKSSDRRKVTVTVTRTQRRLTLVKIR